MSWSTLERLRIKVKIKSASEHCIRLKTGLKTQKQKANHTAKLQQHFSFYKKVVDDALFLSSPINLCKFNQWSIKFYRFRYICIHSYIHWPEKKSRRRKEEVQTTRKFNVASQGHLAHININIRSPHWLSF